MQCAACGSEIMSSAVYCPYCNAQVEGAVEPDEYVYEAFISYRHLPHDQRIAKQIQLFLEGTVIPKEFRNGRGTRFGRLFRDEDELSTSSSLSNMIDDALRKSRYLIVVCTPDTRKSQWVLREVETFASLHGRDKILIALAKGEPSESFPPLLLSHLEWDENSGEYVKVESEPLAADFREGNEKNYRREAVRFEATILGCGFDDLQQRIRMRRLRMNMAISAVVAVVSILFGAYTLYQREEIAENYRASQINESKLLARESDEYLNDSDRIAALRSSLSALPVSSTSDDRPYVTAAQLSLERALGIFPRQSCWESRYTIDGAGSHYDCRDGIQAMEDMGNAVVVSRVTDGSKLMAVAPYDSDTNKPGYHEKLTNIKLGESSILAVYESQLSCLDYKTQKEKWSASLPHKGGECDIIYLEKEKQFVILSYSLLENAEAKAPEVIFFDEETGDVARTVSLPHPEYRTGLAHMSASEDGRYIVLGLSVYEPDTSNTSMRVYLIDCWEDNPTVREAEVHDFDGITVTDICVDDGYVVVAFCGYNINEGKNSDVNLTYKGRIECFDLDLQRLWMSDEFAESEFVTSVGGFSYCLGIAGVCPYKGSANPWVVCNAGKEAMAFDANTGDFVYEEEFDTEIIELTIISKDDEDLVISGCTANATLFIRTPGIDLSERTQYYTRSYDTSLTSARPIFTDGRFIGYAAWTWKPPCRRIYDIDDYWEVDDLQAVSGISAQRKQRGGNLVFVADDELCMFDQASFETAWRVPLKSLAYLDPDYYAETPFVLSESSVFLCGQSEDDVSAGVITVGEFSLEDGSKVNEYKLPLSDESGFIVKMDQLTTQSGKRLLMLMSIDYIYVYDLDTSSIVTRCVLKSGEASGDSLVTSMYAGAYLCEGSVVALRSSASRLLFEQYSLETGKLMDTDLTDNLAAEIEEEAIDFTNAKRTAFMARCTDGVLRCFSTADGSCLWTLRNSLHNPRFLCSVGADRAIVQDMSGRCHLIDSSDGSEIAYSETVLPQLTQCTWSSATKGLATIEYRSGALVSQTGLIVFTLDEETFGAVSDIPFGVMMSKDGTKVLADTPWADGCVVYPRYKLDDMIELANAYVKAFDSELSRE